MSGRRIVPCLDVKGGRVVKGVQFKGLRDMGHPPEMAAEYERQGASELTILFIGREPREQTLEMLREAVSRVSMPLTVGGGIGSVEDMRAVLEAGAAKASIASAALSDPGLIDRCAAEFGSEQVVVAIDARRSADGWEVYSQGGKTPTGRDALEWALEAQERGAGELLLTSMDADGTKDGYDLALTGAASEALDIPVIASGGCGSMEHVLMVLKETKAAGALAASIFHQGQHSVGELRDYLRNNGITVR